MTKQIKIFLLFYVLTFTSLCAGGMAIVDLGVQRLESGKELHGRIEIRTAGKLNNDSTNVILMPTAFGQTTEDIVRLTGPGKLADSTKYFVVMMGAPGNGVSTSPSNTGGIDGRKFPVFTIRDMVRMQQKAVTRHLGLRSVYALIGGSLGGMQVLEWIVMFPDMAEKAVVYVSTPALSAPDLLHLSAVSEIIENGWKSGQNDRETAQSISLLQAMNARTPGFWERTRSRKEMASDISTIQERFFQRFNSADHYSQIQAILSHDITEAYGGSIEEAARNIRTELLIIVSEQDHSVHPGPCKELAQLTGAELLILDNDCGHYGPSCEKPLFYRTINAFLEKR